MRLGRRKENIRMDLRPTIDDTSSAKTHNPEGWSGLPPDL